MFDLGFIRDIRYVMRRLPPPGERLSMLFSATLSQRVLELAYEHMNEPELVRIEPDKVTADRIRQVIYFPSNHEKIPLLVGLLEANGPHSHHGFRQHQAGGRGRPALSFSERCRRRGNLRRCPAAQARAHAA